MRVCVCVCVSATPWTPPLAYAWIDNFLEAQGHGAEDKYTARQLRLEYEKYLDMSPDALNLKFN